MTAEEFADRHAGDYVELVRGQTVPLVPGGALKGCVCGNVNWLFGRFIDGYDDGLVCSNDTFVLTGRNPDSVRGGDLVYWSRRRHPTGHAPDGVLDLPPDLVVEVLGPSECPAALRAKVDEYLQGGVGAVVVVDIRAAAVTTYRTGAAERTAGRGDEFTLPDVLPGFAVPVARFFE